MNLTDSRLQVTGGCEKLELAMLSFFEQFRKIYVGDQVILLSKKQMKLTSIKFIFIYFVSGTDDFKSLQRAI
jgi:exportin-7